MTRKKEKIDYKSYNLPKRVKVGAVNYDIIFPYAFDEDSAYVGLHEFDTLTIKLGVMSPSHQLQILPKQRVHQSFLHEIIHAVESIFCDGLFTEAEVEAFTMGWHAVLAENDLHLKKNINIMPRKVKIFSLYYDIKYTDFNDIEDQSICSSNVCAIDFSRNVKDMDHQLQKMLLIYMINCMVDRVFEMRFTDDKNEHLNKAFRCFSSGFYQVLYENDLESVFRCRKRGTR